MIRFAILDENNIVENIVVASREYGNSQGWIEVKDMPIDIGDTYSNGIFYDKKGNKITEYIVEINNLKNENSALQSQIDELTLLLGDMILGGIE